MTRIIVYIFLAGVAVGVAGTILVPRVAGPLLPGVFDSQDPSVEGRVAGKLRENDRLLVTLEPDRGSVLATFTERVSEVDLLVATGDTLVISMPEYSPFVENPPIERVAKSDAPAEPAEVDIELPTSADGSAEVENPAFEDEVQADTSGAASGAAVADQAPDVSLPAVPEPQAASSDRDPPSVPE